MSSTRIAALAVLIAACSSSERPTTTTVTPAPAARREIALAYVERSFGFAAAAAPEVTRKVTDTATFVVDGSQISIQTSVDPKQKRTVAIRIAGDGLPESYETVDETFHRAPGASAFYLPVQDDLLTLAVAARWFFDHRGRALTLEPAGTATAEISPPQSFHGETITRVTIFGLDIDAWTVWLDGNRDPFALIADDTAGYIVARHADHYTELEAMQLAADADRGHALAARLAQRHERGLVIRHARLFDSETLAVTPGRSIVMRDGVVERIGDDTIATPAGADELDASGRFVMPGLWDCHAHLAGRTRALLQLAAGVTTMRDMGNEGELPALVARFDRGDELGPRTLLAMRVGASWSSGVPQPKTIDEARGLVRAAAEGGYVQVKVLDEIPKELVPVLSKAAHERGLRFSGHLPTALTVAEFVEAGADEIQHVMALYRGRPRPLAFGPAITETVTLLAQRSIALDPTLVRFSVTESGLTESEADIVARLPPLAVRQLMRYAVPAANRAQMRAAYAAYRDAVRAALTAGVTVVPGTDSLVPGVTLHRELAAYVELGIPAARVLQLATLDAARTMKRGDRSGSIAPGKDADLVVIDGDPTRDIRALGRVDVVVRGGWTMSARELLAAAGVRAQ